MLRGIWRGRSAGLAGVRKRKLAVSRSRDEGPADARERFPFHRSTLTREGSLKDMYYAEKQILKVLPMMAKKADSDDLRLSFADHHKETQGQVVHSSRCSRCAA
jgi:hypothetical protein